MEIILGRFVALASSLVKLFAEKCLREHGKKHLYLQSLSISFINRIFDEHNELIKTEIYSAIDANMIQYDLVIDFYNSTEIPVAFRNMEFEFRGSFQNIRKYPQNIDGLAVLADDSYNQNAIVDLPPKKMTRIKYSGMFYDKNDFLPISESKEVFLIGEQHNGKKFKYKISDLPNNFSTLLQYRT